MSLIRTLLRGAGLEPQAQTGDPTTMVVEQLFGGMFEGRSESGEYVSVEGSFALPPVFRAVRLCSETAGAMPLITYRRQGDRRERATDHDAYALLHEQPNRGMTATMFWTQAFAFLWGWGRLFIGKEFGPRRRVRQLHLIEPRNISIERLTDGSLIFHESRLDGRTVTWKQGEIIYVPLFSVDGVNGLSPIGVIREAIGMGLAQRRHGARFFRDEAIPSGVLQVKDKIPDKDIKERMRREWKERHQRRRDIAILDAGAEFKPITMSMEDAQFVELAGMTRADVADAFSMPPSLLGAPTVQGSGGSLTYGNREADMQHFLTFTLHNPLRKVEEALAADKDLFPENTAAAERRDQRPVYCEFLREELLRPDSKARADFYAKALDERTGWMRRDEVRRLENLPPESDEELRRAMRDAQQATNGHHKEPQPR